MRLVPGGWALADVRRTRAIAKAAATGGSGLLAGFFPATMLSPANTLAPGSRGL